MWIASFAVQVLLTQAEGGGAPPAPGLIENMGIMLPFVLMFGVVYLLVWRPASKQRREHADLLTRLKKDDEVVTNSGILGRVVSIDEKIAVIEVADKVKIRILRDRIAGMAASQQQASGK